MDGMEMGGKALTREASEKRAGLLPPHPPVTCASIPFVCLVILNHRARECRPYTDMSTPP